MKEAFFPHFSVQIIAKKGIYLILRHFLRPFWKAPSISNLQNFENMHDDIASYWLKSIFHIFVSEIANISLIRK